MPGSRSTSRWTASIVAELGLRRVVSLGLGMVELDPKHLQYRLQLDALHLALQGQALLGALARPPTRPGERPAGQLPRARISRLARVKG